MLICFNLKCWATCFLSFKLFFLFWCKVCDQFADEVEFLKALKVQFDGTTLGGSVFFILAQCVSLQPGCCPGKDQVCSYKYLPPSQQSFHAGESIQ